MRLREIINLARGFRFLRVFVAELIQTVKMLRRLSGNFILLKASLTIRYKHPEQSLCLLTAPFCSLVIEWGYRNNLFCS